MVGAYNKGPTTMNTEVLIALIAAIAAVIAAVAPKFLERKRDLEKKELQRYYMELQSCWDDLEFLLSVEEAQTVAVGEHCSTCHIERPTANFLDIPHIFAHSLRCVERRDILLSSVEEVVRKSAVECLLQSRSECVGTPTIRRTAILACMLCDVSV